MCVVRSRFQQRLNVCDCMCACLCQTHAFPTPPMCQMCELELCLPVNQTRRSLEVSHSNFSNQLSHEQHPAFLCVSAQPTSAAPHPRLLSTRVHVGLCCSCSLFLFSWYSLRVSRSTGRRFLVVSVLLMYGGRCTISSLAPYGPCWSRSALQQWGNGN